MNLKNLSVANKIHNKLLKTLNNKKLKKFFLDFKKNLNINSPFAVGVSGGADSLATAYLSKIYAIQFGLKVKFFIVDHKLRPNSTEEAQYVRRLLKKSFIEAKILTWKGKKPTSNIQAKAREKRYELILNECKKLNINHLIIGHHLEDKLENFILRLTRGSGLRGLVSFQKKTSMNKINIERPCLDLKKKNLIYIANYIFKEFIKDPSNDNQDFKRVRVRKLLENLSLEGLDQNKLDTTINNLSYSNKAIKYAVDENINKNIFYSKKRKSMYLNKTFFECADEIKFRSLSKCIRELGNKYYFARAEKIKRILNLVSSNKGFKTTLGGCIIKKTNNTVIIKEEI